MSDNKAAVFGIYSTRSIAEIAVASLVKAGIPPPNISVLLPENPGGPTELGTERATKAPGGTTAGLTAGGVIGGARGLLAGVGLLAIPGLGPFIAAGPIAAGLAAIGVGSAIGGAAGALIGLGLPEFEARRYEDRLKNGGILLSVHCATAEETQRAKNVLNRTGGEDVSSTGESSVDVSKTDTGVATKAARGSR